MTEALLTKNDTVERIGGALVQHGPLNDRAYLLRSSGHPTVDAMVLRTLGEDLGYGKLFAKTVRPRAFERVGFQREAVVQLPGGGGLTFVSRFMDPDRNVERHPDEVEAALGVVASKLDGDGPDGGSAERSRDGYGVDGVDVRLAGRDDLERFAHLYAEVFDSYPFPIGDVDFLREGLEEGTVFLGAWEDERLLGAASAEIDEGLRIAEMTDFATRPEARGRGIAGMLLARAEAAAAGRGVGTAYTIARSTSPGMNLVFARAGYGFGGRLVSNTHVSGRIESMHVWHRRL